MAIRAVLFDMDGTLFQAAVDWREVRQAMGIPNDGRPILDHLCGLTDEERAQKMRILARNEERAARRGSLRPGAKELLAFLGRSGIPCALVTNNSRLSVESVLRRYGLAFDLVVTRDDGVYKPDPQALLFPLGQLGIAPAAAALVGDSHLDLIAAQRAEIGETILISPPDWARAFFPPEANWHEATDLIAARTILEQLLRSK